MAEIVFTIIEPPPVDADAVDRAARYVAYVEARPATHYMEGCSLDDRLLKAHRAKYQSYDLRRNWTEFVMALYNYETYARSYFQRWAEEHKPAPPPDPVQMSLDWEAS
jgi:hypothetical protein